MDYNLQIQKHRYGAWTLLLDLDLSSYPESMLSSCVTWVKLVDRCVSGSCMSNAECLLDKAIMKNKGTIMRKHLLQWLAHSINSEIIVAFSKIRESYHHKTLQGLNFAADTGTTSSTPPIHTTNACPLTKDNFSRYPLLLNYFNY